jgi:deoxyribonuclease V
MNYKNLHPWNVSPNEAIEIQKQLAGEVRKETLTTEVKLVAGADISFERFSDTVYAGFVVIDITNFNIVAQASVRTVAQFPYIPGLLSFREAPPLLAAWQQLDLMPDVVMFDGQGIAHPRRLGIAAHMGLIIDCPTIGCAKTLLLGNYETPALAAGSYANLMDGDEQIGVVLRTKRKVKPIFISIGHRIDLASAIYIAMRVVKGYRIPEPTRQAHILVNQLRMKARED